MSDHKGPQVNANCWTVNVPSEDAADDLRKALNKIIHDAWQDGYAQACKDREAGEQQ